MEVNLGKPRIGISLVHQTLSANRCGAMFNVCRKDLLQFCAVAIHTIPDSFLCRHERCIQYSVHIL